MIKIRKLFRTLLIFLAVVLVFYILYAFYPYIFSKKVVGEIMGVERVQVSVAMMSSSSAKDLNPQLFSFAVAIKDQKTGEIFTASSEDRQWAVALKGQCAVAEFFPNPPWELKNWGTFFNARLRKLYECGNVPTD